MSANGKKPRSGVAWGQKNLKPACDALPCALAQQAFPAASSAERLLCRRG